MNDEQFNVLQNEIKNLAAQISNNHNQQFEWARALNQMQFRIENTINEQKKPQPWTPFYLRSRNISPDYPEIFNKHGEKMEVFFISDRVGAHVPNSSIARYVIWDRYNYGLKTHFYSHDEMFRVVGNPERKFGVLIEPRIVLPQSYQNVIQNKDYIEKNFDALFTFDAQILSTFKNAKFAPMCAEVWYGRNLEGIMAEGQQAGFSNDGAKKESVTIRDDQYKFKTKNISMICSAKDFSEGHRRRKKLAFKVKNEHLADTYGQFDGGEYCAMELPFEEYRYSIAVENNVQPFYFTEKLLNCFAAQTIPVYLGATEIRQFFNPEGIIQIRIEDCEHIEDILKQCTPEEYERRLPAVLDNFNRAKHYASCTRWDDIYTDYLRK